MIKNPLLQSYWIESPTIGFGLGVTAYSRYDAFKLLGEAGFMLSPDNPDVSVVEGVGVSDLDTNHVVPNIGPLFFRGIWHPRANL